MRISRLFIGLLLLPVSLQAQPEVFSGAWFSRELDECEKTGNYYSFGNHRFQQAGFTILQQSGNRYRFLYEYYDAGDSNKIKVKVEEPFDLLLKTHTPDSLVVSPASAASRNFFGNRETITFLRQPALRDTAFHFEKLVYRQEDCQFYGTCPETRLEIDNRGNFSYFRALREDDTEKAAAGNYAGRLTDSAFRTLVYLLQCVPVEKIYWQRAHCSHTPKTTFHLYYNGRNRYFEAWCPPPRLARDLFLFLDVIYRYRSR